MRQKRKRKKEKKKKKRNRYGNLAKRAEENFIGGAGVPIIVEDSARSRETTKVVFALHAVLFFEIFALFFWSTTTLVS